MRLLLAILGSMLFLSSKAQTNGPVSQFPVSQLNFTPLPISPDYNQLSDSSHSHQKWHLSTYTGLSAGYVFFAGGGTSFISAPLRLQLSRPLNKNLYAFAGISAAPVFFNSNRFVTGPALNSSHPGMNSFYPGMMTPSNIYGLGINSSIQAGLMYINDAKTFSISGSVGVDRGSYPVYPANNPPARMNTRKQ